MEDALKAAVTCPVCFEVFNGEALDRRAYILGCGHTFCSACVGVLLDTASPRGSAPVCPTCRTTHIALSLHCLTRNFALECVSALFTLQQEARSVDSAPASSTVSTPAAAVAPLETVPPKRLSYPASSGTLPRPASVAPAAVAEALLRVCPASGPVSLSHAAAALRDAHVWPPEGLLRHFYGPRAPIDASALRNPTPDLVKAFVQWYAASHATPLHVERGAHNLNLHVCAGGEKCTLRAGGKTPVSARMGAVATPAASRTVAWSSHGAAAGTARGGTPATGFAGVEDAPSWDEDDGDWDGDEDHDYARGGAVTMRTRLKARMGGAW